MQLVFVFNSVKLEFDFNANLLHLQRGVSMEPPFSQAGTKVTLFSDLISILTTAHLKTLVAVLLFKLYFVWIKKMKMKNYQTSDGKMRRST